MKHTLDILSTMHTILDVEPLRSAITGDILIGTPPGGDDREHITVNCLSNQADYLQTGIVNVNIYVPQVKSNRANHFRFKQLVDLVVPKVLDVTLNDIHFQLQNDNGIIKDRDRDLMYFYNLRIEFQTFKNI